MGPFFDSVLPALATESAALRESAPLLANVYLHYVCDRWIHRWRQRHARGDVIVVRYDR